MDYQEYRRKRFKESGIQHVLWAQKMEGADYMVLEVPGEWYATYLSSETERFWILGNLYLTKFELGGVEWVNSA